MEDVHQIGSVLTVRGCFMTNKVLEGLMRVNDYLQQKELTEEEASNHLHTVCQAIDLIRAQSVLLDIAHAALKRRKKGKGCQE